MTASHPRSGSGWRRNRPQGRDADLPREPTPQASQYLGILKHLSGNGIDYTTWGEWERLDAHEITLGAEQGRERVKVVARDDMIRAGRL